MHIGGYLFVIVIGALLRWAVTYEVAEFDIQTAGLIIMIVGIVGLVISVLVWFNARGWAAPWHPARCVADDTLYGSPPHDRVVHEHVIREVPPQERVVHEYVPPPQDADYDRDRYGQPPPSIAGQSEDDTLQDTRDRSKPPPGPPASP